MGLRIGTNVPAMVAHHHMVRSDRQMQRSMYQLASGTKFSAPGEDPANFAISEHLRGQVQGMRASRENADSAVSLVQIAEGGLNEQNNILIRMRELAIQAASDSISDVERDFVQREFGQLNEEIDRIAKSVRFGSNQLLAGSGREYSFQVGPNKGPENEVKFRMEADTTSDGLGVSGTQVNSKSSARSAISNIDTALTRMGSVRSSFGAMQSRMQSVVNHLADQEVNMESARSKIADTDIADAVSKLAMAEVKSKFQASVLAQANMQPERALRLLA